MKINRLSLVSIDQAAELLTVSRRSIYDLVERGKLPRPVKITEQRRGFRSDTIEKFIESLEA